MVEQNVGTLDQCISVFSNDTTKSTVSADIPFSDTFLIDTSGTEEGDINKQNVSITSFKWTSSEEDSTSDSVFFINQIQPLWLAKAKDYLKQLEQLKEDWDSYGSPSLSPELLKNAEDFLDNIKFENFRSPFIAPVHGGGVQFEWVNNDKELEVEFVDQSVFGYVKLINGKSTDEGEIPLNNRASARELIRWLELNE